MASDEEKIAEALSEHEPTDGLSGEEMYRRQLANEAFQRIVDAVASKRKEREC